MKSLRHLSLFALLPLILSAKPVNAQTPLLLPLPKETSLVHLDTPAIPARGTFVTNLELRTFGGDEDLVYTGIGVQYGFGNGWSGLARGTFAGRENHSLFGGSAAIRHGGSEVELAAKYQPKATDRVAGLIGITFPDTSAQNDPTLTLGIAAGLPVGKSITLYTNPHVIFIKDNTLVGLGLGVRARLSDNLSLIADVTPLLTGDNTRSTDDGTREWRTIYGVGVRFTNPKTPVSFELGFANGTGRSTGSSLTPGLGGSGAFYAGLTLRR
jgi:hypothetical protein